MEAEILAIRRDEVSARPLAVSHLQTEPRLQVTLYQALLPSDRFSGRWRRALRSV